jgi:soluble lytic murein transglycosylase-like protein
MAEMNTTRQYQERFLDGYDRSQLQAAVEKVQPARMSLKKKYATMVLGASLALGGIGIPLTASRMLQQGPVDPNTGGSENTKAVATSALTADLQTAQSIARQVTGGVEAAASTVTDDVGGAATVASGALAKTANVASEVAQTATRAITQTAEAAKLTFFQKQVPFGGLIYQEAKRNDLPPELVAAVVHTESQFVPTARSHAGAMGLMQLVPKTGKWMGANNLMNPAQNVAAGSKYLRYLTDRFQGDTTKAIAAYNAGEGTVRRFHGVPPFKETRNFVSRVSSYQQDLGAQVASLADSQ